MAPHFAAFVGVSLVVIVTPGPDTALTIRNTLFGGRPGGVFTALGVATGQACWTVAASLGVAALLVASEPAFVALRVLGGAYLAYLGLRALLAAVRSSAAPEDAGRGATRAPAAKTAFRQGLLSNLGNPKMAVFFTSLLPQFAPHGSFRELLELGLAFSSLTLVWLTAYAVAVAKVGDLLRRRRVRRLLDGLAGTILVGLGLRLAANHSP
jgi:threonine/homoserine/homoserine lactone efflux protein